jgi:Domain of unknown function (DUF1929)/Glyoxal oxidase N-terminus
VTRLFEGLRTMRRRFKIRLPFRHHDLDEAKGRQPDQQRDHLGHEHPEPFYPQPLVDPQFFAAVTAIVEEAGNGLDSGPGLALARLRSRLEAADRAARLSRRLLDGDSEARLPFLAFVDQQLHDPSWDEDQDPKERQGRLDFADHGYMPVANGGQQLDPLNRTPMLDILVTTAAWAHVNEQEPRELRELLARVAFALERDAQAVLLLNQELIRFRDGVRGPESLIGVLDLLGRGKPRLPKIDLKLPSCLASVMDVLGRPGGSFANLLKLLQIDSNTERITAVQPEAVCAGGEVVLLADPEQRFDAVRPADVGVFFAPCGQVGSIESWSENEVRVRVPNNAISGQVYFAVDRRRPEDYPRDFLGELDAVLAECFGIPPRHGGLIGSLRELPGPQCSDALIDTGIRNRVTVWHPPFITSFGVYDMSGRQLGESVLAEACAPVTVRWEVRSDHPVPAEVGLYSRSRPDAFRGAYPASGEIITRFEGPDTLTLGARNRCGIEEASIKIGVAVRLKLLPEDGIRTREGEFTPFTVALPCPVNAPVAVTLTSSDPTKADVPNGVVFAARETSKSVLVRGVSVGQPDRPAAVITATARGYESAQLNVWVRSQLGRWSVAVHRPGDPGKPQISTVAVHAALLRTGRVLLWSYDEGDWSNIDRGESVVWDPQADTITPVPLARNLFCAGHCFLPDGRLFVAGGQSLSQTVGQVIGGTIGWPWGAAHGADHDVHIFEPVSQTWTRYLDMPAARWYPTCVTLPDGRALVVSGFWSHRHSLVNEDYEISMPGTGILGQRARFVAGICLYPSIFVLPGGALFVHSRNATFLFTPDSAAGGSLGRTLTQVSFTVAPTTRNYPGAAGCVLLPLRPQQSWQARVLVFGGGGATEDKLNHLTPATGSTEIFTYVPGAARQPGWRAVTSLSNPRFMCDGVLLPNGTLLAIGGVATGTADDCSNPVLAAELFDPRTEAWRTLARMAVPRYYHQTALLLPDGSVMVAGSTGGRFHPDYGGGSTNEYRIEVFRPPYLYEGPRPRTEWIPSSATWNTSIDVYSPDARAVREVVLVRAGSTTHQVNTDQRLVELPITERTENRLRVQTPPDATIAPPGWYLCFLLSPDGVPSMGRFIRFM